MLGLRVVVLEFFQSRGQQSVSAEDLALSADFRGSLSTFALPLTEEANILNGPIECSVFAEKLNLFVCERHLTYLWLRKIRLTGQGLRGGRLLGF